MVIHSTWEQACTVPGNTWNHGREALAAAHKDKMVSSINPLFITQFEFSQAEKARSEAAADSAAEWQLCPERKRLGKNKANQRLDWRWNFFCQHDAAICCM